MSKILLGVTGSVAAIKTPDVLHSLKRAGHEVKLIATQAATYFFDAAAHAAILDADEWPGERYRRGDDVLHIELRRWADVFLVAPLDANTLAKFAGGLCDNCLTCVYRAWDVGKPVVLAPAMNTLMWNHPATARHLRQLAEDLGDRLRIVDPESRALACGDVGVGAMAAVDRLVEAIASV